MEPWECEITLKDDKTRKFIPNVSKPVMLDLEVVFLNEFEVETYLHGKVPELNMDATITYIGSWSCRIFDPLTFDEGEG